jgi:hypothetical protein
VRKLILFPILGMTVLGLAAVSAAGGDATALLLPLAEWKGGSSKRQDDNLWRAAPPGGVIADAKSWAKLWAAWHSGQKAPAVDFTRELILVAAGPGPNLIRIGKLPLSVKGDLGFLWSITERGGPGFVYRILKVSRAGVRSVNGKALPVEAAEIRVGSPADYLSADGRLKERLEVRETQSGFAGVTGTYWVIEPDGSWSTGQVMSWVKGGKGAPSATGKLTAAQLAELAKALARHDLARLPHDGRPGGNPHVVTIRFGERSVSLFEFGAARAVWRRYHGIADAVRALCQTEKS